MNHRLFFALWPDGKVRERIDSAAAGIEREHAPGGRRLRRDRLHLTVQFLGDFSPLPEDLVEAACDAASRIGLDAFMLTLDHAGSFRGSRVWWLGCHVSPAALQTLRESLGRALASAGVPVKAHPQFTPHVTIQRNVRKSIAPTPIAPIEWPVSEFVLIDSQAGSGYVQLGRWPLRG
jgi:2'-5' RNA ligase